MSKKPPEIVVTEIDDTILPGHDFADPISKNLKKTVTINRDSIRRLDELANTKLADAIETAPNAYSAFGYYDSEPYEDVSLPVVADNERIDELFESNRLQSRALDCAISHTASVVELLGAIRKEMAVLHIVESRYPHIIERAREMVEHGYTIEDERRKKHED